MVSKTIMIPTGPTAPTLRGTDYTADSSCVVVDRLSYRVETPERGDLVVSRGGGVPKNSAIEKKTTICDPFIRRERFSPPKETLIHPTSREVPTPSSPATLLSPRSLYFVHKK